MSDLRFDGRVAVITGAGHTLGRAYALDLAARGASVVVNDLGCDPNGYGRSREPADAVVSEIIAAGGKAVANYDTVATRAGGQAVIDTAMKAFGRVDIVISNAGILRNAPFEDMTDEQIDGVMGTHLMGAFYVCQPAYRIMKQQGYGRFVIVCSASGLYGNVWQANYAAAKAGLAGLVHSIAIEGKPHGILANGLLPTSATRLGARPDEWPSDFGAEAANDYPVITDTMKPEFVMPMVTWLSSEQCTTTHGLYSATAARYARVFVGAAEGWLAPRGSAVRAEDIGAHLKEIEDTSRFIQPHSVFQEFTPIAAAIRKAQQAGGK